MMTSYSFMLLCLFMFILVLSKTKIAKNIRIFILFVTLLLSFMAMLFNPINALKNGDYTDLIRFYSDIEAFEIGGWKVNQSYLNTTYLLIPLAKVIVYVCAVLKLKCMIQFISCFFVYWLMGLSLYKLGEKKQIDNKYIILAFLLFMLTTNFSSNIGNIRMPIGLSLFTYTLVNDFYESKNKKKCILGYIACVMLHPIFIVLILFRLLMLKNKTRKYYITLLLISSLLVPVISSLLHQYSQNIYISEITYKLDFYSTTKSEKKYEFYPMIFGLIQIILALYLLVINRKNRNVNTKGNLYSMTVILISFAVGSIWNYHLFVRMADYLIYYISIWYMISSSNINTVKKNTFLMNKYKYEIYVFIFVILKLIYYFTSYQYNILVF